MSERCQTKLTEKFDNKNYIIYLGVTCTAIAVLYFYRFHFTTIASSYVLGCLACYYGLNSNILQEYINKLKCHFVDETLKDKENATVKGCETCGSKDCARHDSSVSAEPWVGLQIHKQLDQAIEDFYNAILDQFINSWYSKVTLQPFFVDELRHQLRYASACLLNRAVKINYARFITNRLVPCALRHYSSCARLPSGAALDSMLALHPAAANRTAELNYLRAITNAIMPYLLKNTDLQNSVFRVLIREIFAGWVLLSLTDVLADPYILNTLVILATGDETMAQLPTTPNYKVEFLETFARQTESIYSLRPKLLRVELDLVLSDQECFYAFMQYMKTTSHIHLLQFYNDIKSFQTKLLNPELDSAQQASLAREAAALHERYAAQAQARGHDLHAFVEDAASVKQLQTSRALYEAARQSHALLEKVMLPRFLHSEEFYKLLLGSRTPMGCQKQMNKKPHERLLNTALKIGHRLKGALRSQAADGQVLDCFTNSEDPEEEDSGDNIDLMKFLEGFEESTKGQDLSSYKVVLTNVETKLQAPPRRGTVRVFTITVHCADRSEAGAASLWTVERSEHDFHLLRSKLIEFHGDKVLMELQLPSRKDNSPLETIRYKYEDFTQRLLQKSLLQTSELLRIFLTEDGEFSIVVQAATPIGNSTDLANIYQSVTHKLRKEKGQHLESFLRNLLVSSDIERYQALKHGPTRDVEEAQEINEEVEEESQTRQRRTRNIHTTVFENNFNVEAKVCAVDARHQTSVVGFSQCLMYLLIKVVRARGLLIGLVGSVLSVARGALDAAFERVLNTALCGLLAERRLAHLIRLGHVVLFNKKSSPRLDPAAVRSQALRQLLQSVPPLAVGVGGAGLARAVRSAFDIVQSPQLNKQLVYNLLDLCIMELFPELGSIEDSPPRVPKT